jgi:anti-anti-sigma regulatory factor
MTGAPGPGDDNLEDLYEEAPCGYLSTLPAGAIVRVNKTFLALTGFEAGEVTAGKRFPELLTRPSALLYETQCAPLLRLQGFLNEIAIDLVGRDGKPIPVLLASTVKKDVSGAAVLIRTVLFNAPARREYERELVLARRKAEDAAEQLRIQAELLAIHSALLIPVKDDLRVMPIIGAIDATRGRQILQALLHIDATSGVRTVILDLTGVPALDATAADTLRLAAGALRLRGLRAIATGIRPAVAAALVELGLELTGLEVCGTLQDGIARASAPPRGRGRSAAG